MMELAKFANVALLVEFESRGYLVLVCGMPIGSNR